EPLGVADQTREPAPKMAAGAGFPAPAKRGESRGPVRPPRVSVGFWSRTVDPGSGDKRPVTRPADNAVHQSGSESNLPVDDHVTVELGLAAANAAAAAARDELLVGSDEEPHDVVGPDTGQSAGGRVVTVQRAT